MIPEEVKIYNRLRNMTDEDFYQELNEYVEVFSKEGLTFKQQVDYFGALLAENVRRQQEQYDQDELAFLYRDMVV